MESQTERKRTVQCLVVITWISCILLAARIMGFFLWSYVDGNFYRWKVIQEELHHTDKPWSNAAMSLHLATSTIILVLGSAQLLPQLRKATNSWIHRWIGRLYVVCSILTSIGGIYYIIAEGCIGGFDMDVAFFMYGIAILVSAVQTWSHARQKSWEQHKLWSWRLYSMALASWLYRIEYGILLGPDAIHPLHELNFTGPMDKVMNWFFFVPNLFVVEYIWRHGIHNNSTSNKRKRPAVSLVVLKVVTVVVLIVTVIASYLTWVPNAIGRAGPWLETRLRLRLEQQQQQGIKRNEPFDWTKVDL